MDASYLDLWFRLRAEVGGFGLGGGCKSGFLGVRWWLVVCADNGARLCGWRYMRGVWIFAEVKLSHGNVVWFVMEGSKCEPK